MKDDDVGRCCCLSKIETKRVSTAAPLTRIGLTGRLPSVSLLPRSIRMVAALIVMMAGLAVILEADIGIENEDALARASVYAPGSISSLDHPPKERTGHDYLQQTGLRGSESVEIPPGVSKRNADDDGENRERRNNYDDGENRQRRNSDDDGEDRHRRNADDDGEDQERQAEAKVELENEVERAVTNVEAAEEKEIEEIEGNLTKAIVATSDGVKFALGRMFAESEDVSEDKMREVAGEVEMRLKTEATLELRQKANAVRAEEIKNIKSIVITDIDQDVPPKMIEKEVKAAEKEAVDDIRESEFSPLLAWLSFTDFLLRSS